MIVSFILLKAYWRKTRFFSCLRVILLFPLSCLATPFPCCYSTRGKKVFFFSACQSTGGKEISLLIPFPCCYIEHWRKKSFFISPTHWHLRSCQSTRGKSDPRKTFFPHLHIFLVVRALVKKIIICFPLSDPFPRLSIRCWSPLSTYSCEKYIIYLHIITMC